MGSKIFTTATVVIIIIGACLWLSASSTNTGIALVLIGVVALIVKGFFAENKEYEL